MSITETSVFKHHVERLKAATIRKHSVADLPRWITEHTYIGGAKYSFTDHEYQEKILSDTSREVNVIKPSQVGLSETSVRLALALCAIQRHYTVAYTLPTAGFAGTFMRTRVDPVIQSSPYLSQMIHTTTDNAEVKRLGESYMYMKGAQSSNAPISVPCDHLIHDELDFSDPEVISQYHSRITHSKFKRKHRFSTPTIPNRGIDREFSRSRRHVNLVKCNHCNHWFYPNYFENVAVPGFDGHMRDITKNNLHRYDYMNAYVQCPKCKGKPSLQVEHREWVCENPGDTYVAAGYRVSPFDAPNIITPGYLVESSTQYKRYVDFENFGLGLASEDKESTLTPSELRTLLIGPNDFSLYGSFVMGLDMGLQCHCIVAFCTTDGLLIVVHSEVIPVGEVRKRRKELAAKFMVRMTVVDHQPYTETVLAMQEEDLNLFAAIYTNSKNVETFTVRDREESRDEGKLEIRQVNINRDKAFDALMEEIRARRIFKVQDDNDELWVTQLCDMKRVKEWGKDSEMVFVWKKSEDGNDHFHHATLYAHVASQILGVSKNRVALPFMVSSFKLKEPEILDPVKRFFANNQKN